MRRGRPRHPDLLTPREQEALSLLREGLTNEQIASRLGISESGARYHVSEILSKLGVSSREDAAAWREEKQRERRHSRLVLPVLGMRFVSGFALVVAGVALIALAGGVAVMNERTSASHSDSAITPLPSPEATDDLSRLLGPQHQIAQKRDDGSIVLIELHSMQETRLLEPGACGAHFYSAEWSPSGELLYCMAWKHPNPPSERMPDVLVIVDGAGQQLFRVEEPVWSARWSSVGDYLAYVEGPAPVWSDLAGTLKVVDQAGDVVVEEHGFHSPVAWSSDGSRLAGATDDGHIVIFDLASGGQQSIPAQTWGVYDWALGDLRLLTAERPGGSLASRLFALDSREFIEIDIADPWGRRQHWLAPDGMTAIVLGEGDMASGIQLHLLDLWDGGLSPLEGARSSWASTGTTVHNFAFSGDSRRLFWTNEAEREGQCCMVYEADLSTLEVQEVSAVAHWAVALSPDSELLITLSRDRTSQVLRSLRGTGTRDLEGPSFWRPFR